MDTEKTEKTEKMVFDVKEAAHALRISPWTIRRWIADGKLKAVKLGRRVLLEPAELQRLIDAGRNEANGEGRAL